MFTKTELLPTAAVIRGIDPVVIEYIAARAAGVFNSAVQLQTADITAKALVKRQALIYEWVEANY